MLTRKQRNRLVNLIQSRQPHVLTTHAVDQLVKDWPLDYLEAAGEMFEGSEFEGKPDHLCNLLWVIMLLRYADGGRSFLSALRTAVEKPCIHVRTSAAILASIQLRLFKLPDNIERTELFEVIARGRELGIREDDDARIAKHLPPDSSEE